MIIPLVGKRFGRWLVLAQGPVHPRTSLWVCRCDCGTKRIVDGVSLRHGKSRSCGCFHRDNQAKLHFRHGLIKHPLYAVWCAMIARCYNPDHEVFHRYGGRGISVCKRWLVGTKKLHPVECFMIDMGKRPTGRSLDRKDNDGNYSPRNCRWATALQQSHNSSKWKGGVSLRKKIIQGKERL